MSEERHRIVVGEHEVEGYLNRGYARSEASPRDQMGHDLWNLLEPAMRKGLTVVEIGKAAHEAKQKLPQKFILTFNSSLMARSANVGAVDVMEEGPDASVVAWPDGDTCPAEVKSSLLGATARDAVAARRDLVIREIEAHRAAANELEKFLRGHEVL